MAVPEIEKEMGIEGYASKSFGIGGSIRGTVEDFEVEEGLIDGSRATIQNVAASKSPLGATTAKQRFLLCVLVKRNWDTFISIKHLAQELAIDQGRIQIAGIKDAKAITAQYVTIDGVSAEEAAAVLLKDIELKPLGYFHEPICSFYLLGNHFKIKIRGIDGSISVIKESVAKTWTEIETSGGIPNFYGHQRFGTTRAITHLVGKAIVNGNLEEAAMVFLAKPSPFEHPESRAARTNLLETKDFKRAYHNFPAQLRFERMFLAHLNEKPDDFSGAFRRLPPKLRMLFVQAWQSHLFNRFLSKRIQKGLSLGTAEIGDYVVNVERSGLPIVKSYRIVNSANLDQTNTCVKTGRMRVALPIYGARQRLSEGEMGELETQVLMEEGVISQNFNVPDLPETGARGELRAATCPVRDFTLNEVASDSVQNSQIQLEFQLLRGSYATVFLREIMKPENPIDAGF